MIKTYIHSNDCKTINTELLSLPSPSSLLTINVFKKNNSVKWKNNCSTSGFVSNNSPNNYLTESLNSVLIPFSSVFFKCESEQHLNSGNIFPPLFLLLSTTFSHLFKVDSSPCNKSNFENLLLNFVYGSSSSPPALSFSNNNTNNPTASEKFEVFHQLPVHVFSSLSFFYYSLH
jgi:hypothetical protein